MAQHESSRSPSTAPQEVPVLPLRDVVVYPHMVIPLFVGRDKSIRALDGAMANDKQILLVAQKSADVDDPAVKDLHEIGTLANILQLLKLPDGTVKVLVEGNQRARIERFLTTEESFSALIEPLTETLEADEREQEVLIRSAVSLFDQYVKLNKKVPPEVLTSLSSIDEAGRLADTMAAHMSLKLDEKQRVLEMIDIQVRIEHLMGLMESENDILQMEKRIRGRVKRQMEKNQREYYLNEQMKAIQKELGELDEAPNEIEELAKRIENAGMPKDVKTKALAELNKLKLMSPMSAEATVVRNYVDTLVSVPWKERTRIRNDIRVAEQVLDKDHYGLERVKERILEYLAVQQRVRKLKGPILCLVGPPGVGKTSLGSPSRARPIANSPACPLGACATRPRFAAIGAPTSAHCRARSSRICVRLVRATPFSCWTRSTRWQWTSGATRPLPSWRFWTRSRIIRSTTTTSRWITISLR